MNLRRRFNMFCFRNRDKGIPNLMLYVALGNAIVLIMSIVNGGSVLYELLCFDKERFCRDRSGGCSPMYLPSPSGVIWN